MEEIGIIETQVGEKVAGTKIIEKTIDLMTEGQDLPGKKWDYGHVPKNCSYYLIEDQPQFLVTS